MTGKVRRSLHRSWSRDRRTRPAGLEVSSWWLPPLATSWTCRPEPGRFSNPRISCWQRTPAAHCSSAGNSGCAYAASRASTIIMNRRRNRRCSNAWPEARTWHLSPTRARPSLRIPVTGSPGQPGKKASPFIPYQVLQLRSRLFQQPASLRCHTRSSDLCPGTGRAGKNSFQPSLRCREPWSSLNARTD